MTPNRFHLPIVLAACLALASCSLFNRGYSIRPIENTESVDSVIDVVKRRMYAAPKGAEPVAAAASAVAAAAAASAAADAAAFDACSRGSLAGGGDACKSMRNATVATLVGVSDDACNEHLKSIYGNEASWNIGLGTLSTLFSGTAAVVGTTAAKSNYAAAGTFFGAERSLANEVVYKNQLVPAIHFKLKEKRLERRNALFQRFTDAADIYPFRAAVADAIQYHYTCSFMEGLQWALREGTTNTDDTKLLRARDNLRAAQAELAAAQNAFAVRKAAKATTGAETDDPVVKSLMDRVDALNTLIKQLESGTKAAQ